MIFTKVALLNNLEITQTRLFWTQKMDETEESERAREEDRQKMVSELFTAEPEDKMEGK
jgi:predicted secreted protein